MLALAGAFGTASAGTALANGSRMDHCLAGLVATLPAPAVDALGRIDGMGRKLLALRSYVRNRDKLAERWSWTAEQIARYESSPEYSALQADLAAVRAAFERANPGHTLYVNSQVRSLDVQIRRWNENPTVAAAARGLEKAVRRQLDEESCGKVGAAEALSGFLTGWHPRQPPALAAPGLSRHGQARAFDFQIMRGGRIVAGARSAAASTEWDRPGWTRKLRAAVTAATVNFSGPLPAPYEPWHYEYLPEAKH